MKAPKIYRIGNTYPIEKNNNRNWCRVIHSAKKLNQLISTHTTLIIKIRPR